MISEFEFFHGVVFTKLIHYSRREISLKQFDALSNSSYVMDETIGLYIKYSSMRMTPWRFHFSADHQAELIVMDSGLKWLFVLLICNEDGVVCLSYKELRDLFHSVPTPNESISAVRHKRQMYTVKGSTGNLDFKIGQNEFPEKIFRSKIV